MDDAKTVGHIGENSPEQVALKSGRQVGDNIVVLLFIAMILALVLMLGYGVISDISAAVSHAAGP
jgi:hypothetical protein